MSMYQNAVCSECGFFGLCVVVEDECYCDACVASPATYDDDDDFEDDFEDDDTCEMYDVFCDPDFEHDSFEDDGDMYGDDFNPISQGMYDDE